jgi:hypothetical protein
MPMFIVYIISDGYDTDIEETHACRAAIESLDSSSMTVRVIEQIKEEDHA